MNCLCGGDGDVPQVELEAQVGHIVEITGN